MSSATEPVFTNIGTSISFMSLPATPNASNEVIIPFEIDLTNTITSQGGSVLDVDFTFTTHQIVNSPPDHLNLVQMTTTPQKLTINAILNCDPYTQILDLSGTPACDNCLLKADFTTNTAATCSNYDANIKFYDFTMASDVSKTNTHTKYYGVLTLLNYDWVDYTPITNNVALLESMLVPSFAVTTGITLTFEILTSELPTLPVTTSPQIKFLVKLSDPMYTQTLSSDVINFTQSSTRLVDNVGGKYINLVSQTTGFSAVFYPDCGDMTAFNLDPSGASCVPCVSETDFTTNNAVCTASEDVKYYDWAITSIEPVVRIRRILQAELEPNEHLINLTINQFDWPNLTPFTSNPSFFEGLVAVFVNSDITLTSEIKMYQPPSTPTTELSF